MSVIKISEIQEYVAGLIAAHPKFLAASMKIDNTADGGNDTGIVLDDGTYPKTPGLETALSTRGLAIIVWRVGCIGLVDANKTGVSNDLLHVAVVIQENVTINRAQPSEGITPVGIEALDAYQYVSEAISGNPKGTPPGTPLMPHDPPFENLGKVNGVLTIVADFTKQHRITPI